jgi:hypothetical protein
MPDRGEGPQSDGGRRIILPPDTSIASLSTLSEAQQNVTKAINSGNLESTDISPKGAKAPVPMVHGRARVWIAGGALAIALIGPCTTWVPDNVKTGFLAIAGTISASLFKGFESN